MKTNQRLLKQLGGCRLSESKLEGRFDEFIDETHVMIEAFGISVFPSDFMKTHDETAYRCEFSNWLDSECGESIKEYDGEYYGADDFNSALSDAISEVEGEISILEAERENSEDPEFDKQDELDKLETELSELKDLE